jgi:transposase-like protein
MKQNRSAEFKCRVALEALKEDRPLNEIAKEYEIHPLQVGKWKKQLREKAKGLFVDKRRKEKKENRNAEEALQRKVGQLTMEVEWLKKKLSL